MDSSFNLAVHALVCLSHSERSLSSEVLAENIYFTGEKSKQYMKETEHSAIQDTAEHPEENGWSSDLDLSEFEEILSDEEVPF